VLRDDGLGSDRVAGDLVYTTGPIRYNTSSPIPFPDHYRFDEHSPSGIDIQGIGTVAIQELGGGTSNFLVAPEVGLLRSDVPNIQVAKLSSNVVASPHLINVRTSDRQTQRFLRQLSGADLAQLTERVYEVLPDAFDFLLLFSTNKIERTPFTATPNFNAGIHQSVQVNYNGTGQSPFDNSATYGSDGKLLSVNVLDALQRGIYSANATHEILHQWSYYLSSTLSLGSSAHPSNFSNIGSLLGGFEWIDNGDGTFSINADEGRNGATHLSPFDAYLMGLTDGSDLGTLYAYDESSTPPLFKALNGEPVTPEEIVATMTLADIQAIHGVRTPTPAAAQRDFAIGFVAESHERLLTATEMTFYDLLAEHYTSQVPLGEPDPYIGFNWAPISRFFGHGTTWTSTIPLPLPGDFNGNGIVDAADYTLWRDHLGTSFSLGGNGDETGASAGVVDQADYLFWKSHFGETPWSGSSAFASVPEPAPWILFVSSLVMRTFVRRYR
jgi:hypothetical protein